MRKKRVEFIDDGRVIAPMNVDGMPWYRKTREQPTASPPDPQPLSDPFGGSGPADSGGTAVPVKLTRRENIAFMFGVLKAVLLITFVFIGTFFFFILFCTNVWLK